LPEFRIPKFGLKCPFRTPAVDELPYCLILLTPVSGVLFKLYVNILTLMMVGRGIIWRSPICVLTGDGDILCYLTPQVDSDNIISE